LVSVINLNLDQHVEKLVFSYSDYLAIHVKTFLIAFESICLVLYEGLNQNKYDLLKERLLIKMTQHASDSSSSISFCFDSVVELSDSYRNIFVVVQLVIEDHFLVFH
jgi:hypothetical protein